MHGGDIYRNNVKLDFSVNINPLGVPEAVLEAMKKSLLMVEQYPDISCEKLKKAIGKRFDIVENQVVCGNGASELILAICNWRKPKKAYLLAPYFSGYKTALQAVGCETEVFVLSEIEDFRVSAGEKNCVDTNQKSDDKYCVGEKLLEKIVLEKPDITFITNPSNPTGLITDVHYMRRLIESCRTAGTTLVVDECFMELTAGPERFSMVNELIKKADNEYRLEGQLLVLRAFTKSFAIPGVRLGYLLCEDEIQAEEIEQQLPEWNVSVLAQEAGVVALECTDYLNKSRKYISAQRECLTSELEKIGIKVYPSDANFILIYCDECELYEELLKKRILIRDCSDYEGLGKGFYRVAVKTKSENEALIESMRGLLEGEKV